MIQKRIGVFETNSSSTHTLCIVPKDVYEKVVAGELFISRYGDTTYTRDDAIDAAIVWRNRWSTQKYTREMVDAMDEDTLLQFLKNEEIVKFDDWGSDWLEWFEESYTTPSGDEIVVFGQYGYDG